MSIIYFVIDPPDGYFHVAYQIPGTNTFSSVACCKSKGLASDFAAMLNGRVGNGEESPNG